MAQQLTPREVHAWFKEHFRERPEIGVCNAMLDLILEPRNPFEPEQRRWPKQGFLTGVGVALFALGWFCYFNFRQ